MSWRPTADPAALRARAALLATIRGFFAEREVLEVETPLLCRGTVTDPALEPLAVTLADGGTRYLQTSPEYAMKRLLAAGSGPIFQLARAFRAGEAGNRHNPEFTLLEWYRPGMDHHQLMTEVAALVERCLDLRGFGKTSYRDLFSSVVGLDPFTAPTGQLELAARRDIDVGFHSDDRDVWLDLLMSHRVEPTLAGRGLQFVYDYPLSQAALARAESLGGVEVGCRFELYVDGLELANGYYELADAGEQRRRFAADNARRQRLGLPVRAPDEQLLAALAHGLPECSGVALGVDRLLMLRQGVGDIREVLAFDWSRC
jgi:lysyl-tRNA synthetase class 2